jgi:Tfp pilus assembly protein PilO
MDKYKKYIGLIIFLGAIFAITFISIMLFIRPMAQSYLELKSQEEQISQTLETKRTAMNNIQKKLAKLKESVLTSQKKIYSPVENNLGDDTLFFTLYSDLIEMVHSNSIKIDSIDYKYNPDGDAFVAQGETYFVCDVNLKLVSNYVNLGKLIQDIYQYPYYIKINNIDVYPYPKDKKILLTSMSVRLYAHTAPEQTDDIEVPTLEGAETSIPQE